MTDTNQTPIKGWTRMRAIALSAVCLMVGIGGGWSIRGLHSPAVTGASESCRHLGAARSGVQPGFPGGQSRSIERNGRRTGSATASTNSSQMPSNPDLLTSIGNLYYDAQQYSIAVDYYGRALKARPGDAAVRTDMGTAYWFMGNADTAIAEFNKALTYTPNNANTLFNLGLEHFHYFCRVPKRSRNQA
jgi:TPR repeat protein